MGLTAARALWLERADFGVAVSGYASDVLGTAEELNGEFL